MNVSCPECRSVFRVDPARVPGPGIRARCSVCGGIIAITSARSWTDDFAVPHDAASLTTAPSRAAGPTGSASSLADRGVGTDGPRAPAGGGAVFGGGGAGVLTPPSGLPRSVTPTRVPPFAPGRRPTPAAVPPVHAPSAEQQPHADPRLAAHAVTPKVVLAQPAAPPPPVRPIQAAPVAPLQAAAPQSRPAEPERRPPGQSAQPSGAPPAAAARTSDVPIGAPAARPVSTQPPAHAPSPFPSPALPTSQPAVPAAPAARSGTTAATPSKAPINPFLANDPNQKAKRLARALVSDMVAYHPQKRDEGLRSGTLKQLFREEIKKSYEEYVDQIGKEFAETTSHFQDALNDVLAGGKKVF